MRSCLAHIQRNLQCTKLQMSRSLALRRTFFLAFFPFYFIIWSRARPGHVAERRFSFVKFVCVSAATIFFFIFLPSHSTSRFSSFALFTHCRQRAFVERVEPRDSLKIKIGKIFLWAFFFLLAPALVIVFRFILLQLQLQSAAAFTIHIRQFHDVSLALTSFFLL